MLSRRLRPPLAVASRLCATLALPALAPARENASRAPRPRPRQDECANVDLAPSPDNLAAVRAAMLCLHNRERAARGLPPLKENAQLRNAAVGHSDDMVARRYFEHDEPAADDMVDRIKRAGLRPPRRGLVAGREHRLGHRRLATPAEIDKAWMASPGHRANILRRSFREIGIGIALGNPSASPADAGATYTADFGVRR